MTVRVTIRVNEEELRRLRTSAGLQRDLFRRAQNVRGDAVRRCPVDTGRLRASITADVVPRDDTVVARIGTNVNYAIYVHEGTGIFGPTGRPITPKRGRYLVWTPRGALRPVFARSVRGARAVPFLRDALRAAGR